ncbi:MAG: hypothetical protein HZA50_17545 [Planctomycetes bacterium]|nr:hypothetical protein [Planctomycetota bacterium]
MCPFVDKSEPRCSSHLRLRNIFQAFTHCADRYADCQIYHILQADARRQQLRRPVVRTTAVAS